MASTAMKRRDVETAVAAAIAAPSIFNTQPWLFEAGDDVIDLFGDSTRMLPLTDEHQRALCLSCGAALLNLRLAVCDLGRAPLVELLPTPDHDQHLARVRFGQHCRLDPEERMLHDAIPHRRTSRLPYTREPVPAQTLEQLRRHAKLEGAEFHVLDAEETRYAIELTHDADRALRFDPGTRKELLSWVDRPGRSRDGIAFGPLGPAPKDPAAGVRDFAMGFPVQHRTSAEFERLPTLAVLLTRNDRRPDWLRAGQALQRVLLAATAAGLATSLLTQAAEVPALRALLRSPSLGPSYAHAVLRLGYGPRGPASPRRPVSEVLTFVD